MPGTLTVKPIEAILNKNMDWFKKMDPYCEFILGCQRVRSDVCKLGGKRPRWDDVINLQYNDEATLYVKLMDKDTFRPDDNIGMCQINLGDHVFNSNSPQWFPVSNHNKDAGEILLQVTYNYDKKGLPPPNSSLQASVYRGGHNPSAYPNPTGPVDNTNHINATGNPMMAYNNQNSQNYQNNQNYPSNPPQIAYQQIQPMNQFDPSLNQPAMNHSMGHSMGQMYAPPLTSGMIAPNPQFQVPCYQQFAYQP